MSTHDEFVRKGFDDPKVVAAFCRQFVSADILARVDIDRVRVEKGTFIDKRLRKSYSDLLFSVPLLKGGENDPFRTARIYILIEHKSHSARDTILQLLGYMVEVWRLEFANAKQPARLHLSPIVPIILHHGRYPFSGPIRFTELVAEIPETARFVPEFEVQLIDLNTIDAHDIPKAEPRLFAILSVMQSIFDEKIGKTLREVIGVLSAVVGQPGIQDLFEAIVNYVAQSAPELKEEDAALLNDVRNSEGESIMTTLAERWFAQGEAKGEAKGEARGEAKGKAETIINVLLTRFPEAPEEVLNAVRGTADLGQLDLLARHIALCKSVDEFRQYL